MLTRENFKVAADSSGGGEAINNTAATMVDNNTMSSSGGDSVTTTPNVDNHNNKLILKLPKTTADQEVATSSSCSSSSSSSSISSAVQQSDTRKVEPLKINLLQHTNTNNNNNNNNNNNSSNNNNNNNTNNGTPTVPKITIKPIFAQANSDTAISSDCSSSAEEEAVQRESSVDSSSPSSPNEPHIVPKLTIRSAEEGGTAHSSIVPKLTIKMNEGTTSNLTTTITTTTSANNNTSVLPPPLPKLTIKTMLDGSSGAIISSLSPASSSSSSSNSSGNAQVGGGTNLVPKLTIKTNASGSCVSSTEEQQLLPKLTIKTGQEHAMIITQHSNDASSMLSIPKMTIKTKTLRAEEAELGELRDDEQVGKIPKLTIKTNDDMAPLSPLVVRNLPQNESPDRVPKLMISRQQDNNLLAVNNHLKSNHCMDESLKVSKKSNNCAVEELEKVPKLTIKNINVVTEESLETTMNKSIPKLTIKNLSSPKLKMKAVLDEEKIVNSNDMPINNNNNNNSINNKSSTDNQRDSDDMDIDEALQAHDPKIFNNVSTMFNDFGKSGVAAGSGLLTSAVRRVIDTVDLTASPERSPAHTTLDSTTMKHSTTTPLLLERLQRDTSVIQSTLENSTSNSNNNNNNNNSNNTNTSFLLNQLNAPRALPNLRHTSLPLMANNRLFPPQQQQPQQSPMNKNLKYPNLTERLLANGLHSINTLVPEPTNSLVAPVEVRSKSNENVIDSIEILDTPDGSSQSSLDENASVESVNEQVHQFNNGVYLREETISPNKYANSESPMNFKNDASHAKFVDNFTDLTPNKIRRVDKESGKKTSPAAEKLASPTFKSNNMVMDETLVNTSTTSGHRSRKQKHEHLLTMDEEDPLKLHPMHENFEVSSKKTNNLTTDAGGGTPVRKRGRPKKNPLAATTPSAKTPINNTDQSCKSRRVQLLRKRLAIDMVAAEQPFEAEANEISKSVEKDRSLRTPARAARNGITSGLASGKRSGRRSMGSRREDLGNHFGGSNSSLSSGCSSSSLSSTTITTTTAAQIDLTMSSSSSSANSCSQTTTTLTTAKSKHNTMLPPSKILSSDPVPDVVFKPNDFSSALVTQQFQMHNSGQSSEEIIDAELSSHSEESLSPYKTPTRGRGRGRGSRGTRGSATSARGSRGGARMGRGASAAAKAIAMSRPRCVGGLKHTPDPKRLKGLVSPGPQVFEEDTRMSADLTQVSLQQQQSTESTQHSETNTVVRQLEFLTNDESQSSIISNTSILDPNTVAAMQNGAASVLKQRPKKKKMEVCVAEDTECNVSSIAEYDWPPPKGCCPSKHRDTFMIQEQVALYLGIKSFKRKYPDLPRRQIDMEERNWLQEKNLVSERMCDLGITAVWASDILDIMYADFYDKYEEYKDYVRQKHLREIEAKQKALGMNILGNGRNLQVRERAMLSASKWNSYCGRARKSERVACLDMQSFIVNVPIPATAPAHTMVHREMAEIIADVAAAENIPEPPTLLPKRVIDMTPKIEKAYPLALIPGQYCDNYKRFEPRELYALPLNTALMDVTKLKIDNEAENVKDMKYQNREKRQKRRQRVTKEDDSDTESVSSYSSKGSHSSTSSSSSSCSSSDSDCSSSDNEEIIHRCGVCQRTQNSNLKALPETFIKCYSCARRVHPSCIEMPQRMVARVRNYNWQCATCKCCIKCKRSQDTNKMLFCEQCDRGYHIYCLKLKTVPDGRWSCERCCVCMRCGATKPEGLPQLQLSPSGEKVKQVKHKKVKWINEYRIDHITKLREHCSMLCVPCARTKPANKRVHIVTPPVNSKSVKLSSDAPPTAVTSTTTATNVSETNVIKTNNKSNIVKMNKSQSVSNTTTNHVSTVKLQTTNTTTTTTTLPATNIKTTAAMQPTIQRVKQQQIKPATNKSTTTTTNSSSDVGDISLAGGTAIAPPPVVA